MEFKVTLLPGDGIGPEVVHEAVRVLDAIATKYSHTFRYQERLMGGCSIDTYGTSLTDETLSDCQSSDAVLLGAACSPLLWAWDGYGPLRFALFAAVYAGAAVALGLERLSEVRMLVRALRAD